MLTSGRSERDFRGCCTTSLGSITDSTTLTLRLKLSIVSHIVLTILERRIKPSTRIVSDCILRASDRPFSASSMCAVIPSSLHQQIPLFHTEQNLCREGTLCCTRLAGARLNVNTTLKGPGNSANQKTCCLETFGTHNQRGIWCSEALSTLAMVAWF